LLEAVRGRRVSRHQKAATDAGRGKEESAGGRGTEKALLHKDGSNAEVARGAHP
jgi:hypothetical protein